MCHGILPTIAIFSDKKALSKIGFQNVVHVTLTLCCDGVIRSPDDSRITSSISSSHHHNTVCIGNYKVLEVLMKNHTRVWQNIYNITCAYTNNVINILPNTSVIFH